MTDLGQGGQGGQGARGAQGAQGQASVRVLAPAKVNLFLAVRGARADGYHELVTVMQTIGLHDELEARIVGAPGRGQHPASRRRMRLQLLTDSTGLPAPGENLVVKAAQALADRLGLEGDLVEQPDHEPVSVLQLRKHIPLAGGMAGGSADAAATLVALNELWRAGLSRDELRGIGASIGSDVPFCVVGGTALATGTGTALAQVLCQGSFAWVVCTASFELSTAAVYAAFDRHAEPSEVEPDAVLAGLRGDSEALGAALHNDLEAGAFALRPELAESKSALLDAGALGAVLSGSGPTLLGLCTDEVHAERVAARVRHQHKEVLVARSPAGRVDRA